MCNLSQFVWPNQKNNGTSLLVCGIGCFSRFRATTLSFAKRKKNHVTIECVQQNCQRQLFENVPGLPHFGWPCNTSWIGSWANPKEELEPQQSTWNGEEHDTPTCWSHGWYAAIIIFAQIQVKNLSYCLAKESEKKRETFQDCFKQESLLTYLWAPTQNQQRRLQERCSRSHPCLGSKLQPTPWKRRCRRWPRTSSRSSS